MTITFPAADPFPWPEAAPAVLGFDPARLALIRPARPRWCGDIHAPWP